MDMAAQQEVVFAGQLVLDLLDARIIDLNDFAAGDADHMVVVTVRRRQLVTGDAVAEMDLRGEPGFAKQLERPVDRGLADARILLLHALVELFQRMVAGKAKEDLGDDAPLRRGVHPLAADELLEGVVKSSVIHRPTLDALSLARARTSAKPSLPRPLTAPGGMARFGTLQFTDACQASCEVAHANLPQGNEDPSEPVPALHLVGIDLHLPQIVHALGCILLD